MKSATLDQVKQEQAIFTDLWNIYKQYKYIKSDEEWELYLFDTNDLYMSKYIGTQHEEMYRDLLQDITKQLERNMKNAI